MNPKYAMSLLGDPGKHAWIVFTLACLNYFPVTFNHLAMAIYGAKPAHTCVLPAGQDAETGVPLLSDGRRDTCNVWDNFTAASNKTTPCPDGWSYTLVDGESTIVNEWDLICDQKHMTWTATSIYFAGVMIGGLIFGTLSDKIGRLPVMAFTLFTPLLLGTMLHFVESLVLFIIMRCLIGVLMQGLQTTSYVVGMELFYSSKYRAITAALFETCWSLGVMTLALIAYLLKDWRWIQLGITLPTLLSLLYIWFIPESTRWLLSSKRYRRAKKNLVHSARINKVTLPKDLLVNEMAMEDREEEEETSEYDFFDMFKTPKLRIRSLVMFYVWLATALGYYGLSLNAAAFGGNKYLNFFISGAVEFPAYLSGVFILPYFGRKKPLMVYFLLGGVCCILAGVIPRETGGGTDIKWVSTTLAWIGKFSTAGCWSVVFLYASEIFPTVIRNVGVGACAFWARVGSLIAPQILSLGEHTKDWVPFVILGCVAVLAGLLSALLPETKGRRLPDTIEEAENMLEDGYGENEETSQAGHMNEGYKPGPENVINIGHPKSTQL